MTQVLGWWKYDPMEPGMVNTVTGERVVYRGALGGRMRVTWSENWLRYDYVHSELTFPLVAQVTVQEPGTRDHARAECLSVDYTRSARLWRDDPFGNRVIGTAPAYGVWRRVDDCLVDAFSCWPRQTTGGWNGTSVEFVGGWLNGAWRRDFSRVCNGGPELEKALLSADDVSAGVKPTLMELKAKPPPIWMVPDGGTANGLPSVPDGDQAPWLRGREPCLLTADGRSAIYPPHPDDDPSGASGVFTLVHDADAYATFDAEPAAQPNRWRVHLALSLPAAGGTGTLDYDAWLRWAWSVIDAFGAWRSAPAGSVMPNTPIAAAPPDAISLSNCFRGSVRLEAARCDVVYAR